jgi:hypothetical protein
VGKSQKHLQVWGEKRSGFVGQVCRRWWGRGEGWTIKKYLFRNFLRIFSHANSFWFLTCCAITNILQCLAAKQTIKSNSFYAPKKWRPTNTKFCNGNCLCIFSGQVFFWILLSIFFWIFLLFWICSQTILAHKPFVSNLAIKKILMLRGQKKNRSNLPTWTPDLRALPAIKTPWPWHGS